MLAAACWRQAGLNDLPEFVSACAATPGLPPPDFVSSHHYPSDGKSGPTPMQVPLTLCLGA